MFPELTDLITNIGFPIAVVIYLFWKDAKKMDALIRLVEELKDLVEKLD